VAKPFIFYSKITLYWGFSTRLPGMTAAQPSLILPPETTIVGAFFKPLLTVLGINPFTKSRGKSAVREGVVTPLFDHALEATLSASAALLPSDAGGRDIGLATYMELTRVLASPYKTGGEVPRLKQPPDSTKFYTEALPRIFPVQALGSTYGPGAVLALVWVVDLEKLSEGLASEAGLDYDTVFKSIVESGPKIAHGVSWLGSKEGLATVVESGFAEAKLGGREVRTPFYIPVYCVEDVVDRELVTEIVLWDRSYTYTKYYVAGAHGTGALIIPSSVYPRYRIKSGCSTYVFPGKEWVVGVKLEQSV